MIHNILAFFRVIIAIFSQSIRICSDVIVNSDNLRQHYSYWIYNAGAIVAGEIDDSTLTTSLPPWRPSFAVQTERK